MIKRYDIKNNLVESDIGNLVVYEDYKKLHDDLLILTGRLVFEDPCTHAPETREVLSRRILELDMLEEAKLKYSRANGGK